MSIFLLKAVLYYYRSNKSSMFFAFLDASKAFDRINHGIMLNIQIKKECSLIYCQNNKTLVLKSITLRKWWKSDMFYSTNGVRQGSKKSPLIFNVYIDDLSSELNQFNTGLINHVKINHLNIRCRWHRDFFYFCKRAT